MHKYPARLVFLINMRISRYKSYRVETWIKKIRYLRLEFGNRQCILGSKR